VPLLALVDGVRTVSALLSEEEWLRLQGDVRQKRRRLEMQPCGLPGHLQTSKLGTRYFAHNAGGGGCREHAGESALHLAAKTEILRGCAAAGWDAEPERPGDGWVADVLASSGPRQVAFEVQVSQQPDDEYRRRQDRYAQVGIRCAWFVRHEGSVPRATRDLPAFLLVESEDGLQAVVSGNLLSLQEATTRLLQGAVQFRRHVSRGAPVQIDVVVHESDPCWKCHRPYLLWKVLGATAQGACGACITQDAHGVELWSEDKPEARREVVRAVVAASQGLPLQAARIGKRYSKTAGTTYMAFSCPHCGAIYGDFFLFTFWAEAIYDEPTFALKIPGEGDSMQEPHWCLDTGQGHCQDAPSRPVERTCGPQAGMGD
jgi:hypothetical protein